MTKLAKRNGPTTLSPADARRALTKARTIAEVKDIGDKATAVAKYLRQQRDRWDEALDAEELALEAHIRSAEILEEMRRTGQRQAAVRPKKRDGSSRFRPPLRELFGIADDTARKLASRQTKAADIKENEPERIAEYVKQQRESYGGITLSGLVDAKAHVSQNTGQPEWYTPPEYIEAARAVLGAIDLDPASSKIAQGTVKAERFYTAKDDGLAQEWAGRVWLNPPYSTGLVEKFAAKLCGHVGDGSVPAAVMLVNNATDTGWFQLAAKSSAALCFPAGRIRFLDEKNQPSGAPLQGQAVLYFGAKPDEFTERFGVFGFCVRADGVEREKE